LDIRNVGHGGKDRFGGFFGGEIIKTRRINGALGKSRSKEGLG
jgi:hypothetical protein